VERSELHASSEAGLEPADPILRHPRPAGQFQLGPAAGVAERADSRTGDGDAISSPGHRVRTAV
jgi:hypothetical protein